jgi:hypothetical protein
LLHTSGFLFDYKFHSHTPPVECSPCLKFGAKIPLVTLEDVVETLLGIEIIDEMDEVSDMQALARRQREKRAVIGTGSGPGRNSLGRPGGYGHPPEIDWVKVPAGLTDYARMQVIVQSSTRIYWRFP